MKLLPEEFLGTGEVKGDVFHQKHRSEHMFMYKRTHMETGVVLYEVFKREVSKDQNVTFGGHSRVIAAQELYPKSNSFGKTAWCFNYHEKAIKKFNELTEHYGKEQAKKESGGETQAIRSISEAASR